MGDFTTGAYECFCDRQYKDANKFVSCGDCPRDYIAGVWDARRKYLEEHSQVTEEKLSDRLEAAVERLYEDGMDTRDIADLFRESAELTRRVEDAVIGRRYARSKNDWLVTPDEDGGVDFPYQRVLIVPGRGEE